MSRLAKKSISIVSGVAVGATPQAILVKGPKGEKQLPVLPRVSVAVEGNEIRVSSLGKDAESRMNSGTMWALLRNAVEGVSRGFSKVLEIEGVGFRAAMEEKTLILHIGFSHPVRFVPPHGVAVSVEKNTITISGTDKDLVGRAAAEIRSLKKPEPYKGKGIRYQGEVIRMKVGKKAASTV